MPGILRTASRVLKYRGPFFEAHEANIHRLHPSLLQHRDWLNEMAQRDFEVFCTNEESDIKAVRFQLADAVIGFANAGVLLIPPPPANDDTGMRDDHLVTGLLGRHLADIVANPEAVLIFAPATPERITDVATLHEFCVLLQATSYARSQAWNTVRLAYEDAVQTDWYREFVRSQYVVAEYELRKLLELPTPINDQDWLESLKYSTFLSIVLSGHADPFGEWMKLRDRTKSLEG
jgi:hypothetical protein